MLNTEQFFDALALVPNTRSATFDDVAVSDWKDGFRFEGYAAVFEEEADMGEFSESIERGAFRKVLTTGANVPLLHEHQQRDFLASTRSGRLKLSEDTRGLKVQADIVDTPIARHVYALAKGGEVTGMSYGFVAGQENQRIEQRNGKPHRRLLNFRRLLDVSTTFDPAFQGTEAQFRSLAMQYADSPESLQQLLKGAYPQLEEGAMDSVDTDEETAPAPPEEREERNGESGATPHLAAAKRRLTLMTITLGGDSQ